jgi:hypothetical protein
MKTTACVLECPVQGAAHGWLDNCLPQTLKALGNRRIAWHRSLAVLALTHHPGVRMKQLLAASMLALACGACSNFGADNAPPLTSDECEAVVRKGLDLQKLPVETMMANPDFKKIFDRNLESCLKNQDYSRKDYECLMKATTLEQYQGCNVVIHLKKNANGP